MKKTPKKEEQEWECDGCGACAPEYCVCEPQKQSAKETKQPKKKQRT